jgi:ribosomal protein S21
LEDRGHDLEFMLRRWKRSSQQIVSEVKKRRFYRPPSELRRMARAKALGRERKVRARQQKLMQRG